MFLTKNSSHVSIPQQQNNQLLWFLVAIVLASIILFLWYPLQIYFGIHQYLGAVIDSNITIKNLYSWLPIVRSISDGNIFPEFTSILSDKMGLHFYPYISLYLYSIMIKLGGPLNIAIVGQFLLPIVDLALLVLIFQRYLHPLWAMSLAFLAIISFVGYPFHDFLHAIFQNKLNFAQLGSIYEPEILQFPIPAFTTFIFLLLYYFSTFKIYLSNRRLTILTVLWSLLIFIHPMDAVFGLAFWFSFFSIRLYRQDINKLEYSNTRLLKIIILQASLAILILSPMLYAFSKDYITNENMDIVSQPTNLISSYYYMVYFIVPILSMFIVYAFKRIDYYEIVYKFWHIYILMFIESILIFLISHTALLSNLYVVQNRISFFFLHFYYYIPVIYFASRVIPTNTYNLSSNGNLFIAQINKIIEFIFNFFAKIYLPIFIVLLCVFASISAYRNYDFQKNVALAPLQNSWSEFERLSKVYKNTDTIVSSTPVVNLLATIAPQTQFSSLWVSSYSNHILLNEIIDRLALYGHIFNWSPEQFLQFMLPSKMQEHKMVMVNLSEQQIYKSGIGYWLLFHDAQLNTHKLREYRKNIKKRYQNINVLREAKHFNVKLIYSTVPISSSLLVITKEPYHNGFIYRIM